MHHALQCQFGPYRIQRHNAIRDVLAEIIQDVTGTAPLVEQLLAGTTPQNQPTHAQPDEPNARTNRTDLTWHTATAPVHLDVMVTSAFTTASLAGTTASSITPGHAASAAEQHKRQKYAPHQITPIVFEAHGRFGNDTLDFLRQLTNTLPEPEQASAFHLAIQRLSTTLQLHNALTIQAHLANHMPNTPPTSMPPQ